MVCCSDDCQRERISLEGPLFLLQGQSWVRLWFVLGLRMLYWRSGSTPAKDHDFPQASGDVQINSKCGVEASTVSEEGSSRQNRFVLTTEDGEVLRMRPVWSPDTQCKTCNGCGTTFGLITRKHHCRKCGLIFCGPCSVFRSTFPEIGYTSPVRCCEGCLFEPKNAKTVRPKSAYEKWLEDQGRVLSPSMEASFVSTVSDRFLFKATRHDETDDSDYVPSQSPMSFSSSPAVSDPALFNLDSLHNSEPNLSAHLQPTQAFSRTASAKSLGALSKKEITCRAQARSKKDLKEWDFVRKEIRSSSMVGG